MFEDSSSLLSFEGQRSGSHVRDSSSGGSTLDVSKSVVSRKNTILSSLTPVIRQESHNLAQHPSNRLNFDRVEFCGRRTELGQLNDAFQATQDKKQVVLLAGYSGTGKTALARTLMNQRDSKDVLYVEGKFDANSRNDEPFSAMTTICGAIAAHIVSLELGHKENICSAIETSLGAGKIVLLRAFPILEEILDSRAETQSSGTQTPMEAKYRLNYAVCRFLREIAKFFPKLIVTMDDLQWADAPSLDLLEAIVKDEDTNILLIGIYRSNEVDQTHAFTNCLRDWRAYSQTTNAVFDLHEIAVDNLCMEAVHQYIDSVLSISDSSKSLGLARVCYHRTHGNVFFLIHFLSRLNFDHLLKYNVDTYTWAWDEYEIEHKTKATENVVDLLLSAMQDFEKEQNDTLRLAACLGAYFSTTTLDLLWCQFHTHEKDPCDNQHAPLKQILETLTSEGYLEEAGGDQLHFSHDQIKETAVLLTPEQNCQIFHQWVGQTLVDRLAPQHLESSLFVVVNLLNKGKYPEDETKQVELARLNLRACSKAMNVSAFDVASNYATQGIRLLGADPFSKHYELAMGLYSTGASAENCLGHTHKVDAYCEAIFQQSDRPIEDKLSAYTTWLGSLANRGLVAQAVKEGIRLFHQFDVHFAEPKVEITARTVVNMIKFKALARGGLINKVSTLPMLNDPTREKLLDLMYHLMYQMYISHDDRLPLVMFRLLQWSFKYGMNDTTPSAFTSLGAIVSGVLGDLQLASQCAETALKLMPKVSSLEEARILFKAHGLGLVWTQTMREQLKPLLRGYDSGLRSGDMESAFWCVHIFYQYLYLTGFSLDVCIDNVKIYMPQMKALNQVFAYRCTVVNYQMFMNLAGYTNSDPLSLVGSYCTAEDHDAWIVEDEFYQQQCYMWECYIRTIYGEHEECANLAVKYGPNTMSKSNPGLFSLAFCEVFSKGISCFVASRLPSKKKIYSRIALSIRKRVKDWISKRNPNVAHLDAFFDAEYAVMKGKRVEAIRKYEIAVAMAIKQGLMLDAGVFSEVYGEYLLPLGRQYNGLSVLQEAIEHYQKCGARRKSALITEKYRDRWPKPSVVRAS